MSNITVAKALASNWRITVSDIPGHDLDLRLIDSFVRGWTSPALNLSSIVSSHEGWESRHHDPQRNRGGFDLNLTLAVSDDWVNYYCFADWWERVRLGEVSPGHNEYLMASTTIYMLDRTKRERFGITLSSLNLEGLSGITGVSGTSEELTFDVQLKAHDIAFKLFGVANGAPGMVSSPDLVPKSDDGSIDAPIPPFMLGQVRQ